MTNHDQTRDSVATLRPAQPVREPAVDVFENESAFVLQIDMPGTTRDAIGLRYDRGTLTVEAPAKAGGDERHALLREYRPAHYRRTFRLGDVIDADRVGAAYELGVLTVTLPKKQSARPRRIEIQGE
jgi:HSP20 family protein